MKKEQYFRFLGAEEGTIEARCFTENKVYKVDSKSSYIYTFIDDEGDSHDINKKYFTEVESTQEVLEDKAKRLEEELNEIKEALRKEKEFKVGDIVVGWQNTTNKDNLHIKPWKIGKIDDKFLYPKHRLEDFWNTDVRNIRKATTEEIEMFKNKLKLPKIGGYDGEMTERTISYGCKTITKEFLKIMWRSAIRQFTIKIESTYYNVEEREFKQIIDIINES